MEQIKEVVYLINDERYLHLRENGTGVGFATYNKVTGEPLESGQISEKNLPPDGQNIIPAARNWYLFELSDDDRKAIQQESVKILENIPQAGIGRRRIWEPETLPKDIRLINSHYDDLYRIPDGGVIQVDYPDGRSFTARVEHLDDYHFDMGGLGNVFHICQFAEVMERNHADFYPEIQTQDEQAAWELGGKGYLAIQSCEDEEFMLSKRQYELVTGRRQKSDVIAYQIRQSFKPGEITAEEANKVGYELAMRFTKGKYAFIVATHTDREHIHNHIIYNSTALDSIRKFRDFLLSGLAVQRLSDLICLEHQLSVIEIKPYRERQKRTLYPPKESNRDRLCGVIDTVLAEKPKDYEDFLQGLEQQGYEVKRGKYTSVKGARQKRFIRFRTLGAGYSEEELKAVISGEAEHHPRQKQKRIVPEQKFQMLVDIQAKLAEGKSMGYARWAKRYNLKEMSKTLIFLQEHKIGSIKEMQERVDAATARYHELGDSIKAAEARMTEIAVLRTHIVNYARTRPVYDAYRKAGYSKRFLEAHREEITLHKAAKAAFDEAGLKKLPKTKDLSIEYAELLKKKKEAYPDYRKAQDEMQELMKAQKNVEMFFAEEKDTAEKEPTR